MKITYTILSLYKNMKGVFIIKKNLINKFKKYYFL